MIAVLPEPPLPTKTTLFLFLRANTLTICFKISSLPTNLSILPSLANWLILVVNCLINELLSAQQQNCFLYKRDYFTNIDSALHAVIYEDELNDNGLSETKFRFRVMKDCFFGLLRSYLRVDNVLVRNIDTRIFHSFGDNYIFRNFQVRESTYEELSQRGFDIKSSWSINPNQSDILSQFMGEPIFNKSDEIILM